MRKMFARVGGIMVPVLFVASSAMATGTDYTTGVTIDTTSMGGGTVLILTALGVAFGVKLVVGLFKGR